MIAESYFYTTIFFLGIGTFLIRYSIISLSGKIQISPRAREIFTFIPAAVIPAIVTPMVFFHQGSVNWLMGKERAVVLVFASVVCAFTRSTVITILFGLLALYLLRMN